MTEAADDLPPYQGIALADVRLVRNRTDADGALAALLASDAIGFDTESKPTFQKGEQSTGPHLVQLATDDHAYLFQIGAKPARTAEPAEASMPAPVPGIEVLRAVLESPSILKVGFGLGDDLRRLRAKLGIETRNVLDLSTALPRLTDKQILYAADDAHVALRIYRHWRANPPPPLPPKPVAGGPMRAAQPKPRA